MKKLTLEQFIADYEIVSIHDEEQIKKHGFTSADFCYDVDHSPCFLILFKEGGFIECKKNGNFHLLIDRSDYTDKDWKKLAPMLFEFLGDGEYFEAVDSVDQTIAEIDEILNDLKEVK